MTIKNIFQSYSLYLFDYAEVISLPQDEKLFHQMSHLLGFDVESFKVVYWQYRKEYDRGQEGKAYWEQVAGRSLDVSLVKKLIALDCNSWSRINPTSVELLKKLKEEKKVTALLSNLPIDLVHYLRRTGDFLKYFDHVFFSAELNLVKPETEIYQHILRLLGLEGKEVMFFDDRQENLDGAEKSGMATYLFKSDSAEVLMANYLNRANSHGA